MATNNKTKKASKKTETKSYVEFEYEGDNFNYTGRAYPEYQTKTKKCTITPVSITFNGVMTVKGCKLFVTKNTSWIRFPEYKSGDDYKSFFFIDEDFNDEINALAATIAGALED